VGLASVVACAPNSDHRHFDVPDDAFARKTAALMWPGAHRAFLVAGDTLFNGEWALVFRPMRDSIRSPGPKSIAFDVRPPCLTWVEGDSIVRWTVSVAVLPRSAEPGAPVLASVEFEPENVDSVPHDISLEARFTGPEAFTFAASNESRLPTGVFKWSARSSEDTVVALGPQSSSDSVLVMRARLDAARQGRWRFILASHPVPQRTLEKAIRASQSQWRHRAAKSWRRLYTASSELDVHDPLLEQAVEQAVFVLRGCTERSSAGVVPIGNPFQYRDTWIRDAARQITALSQWGMVDTGIDLAASLLAFKLPDGGFMSQRGQLDGTGQLLWALDQSFDRATVRSVPDSIVDAVLGAWRWCERERGLIRGLAPHFAGLMPPADPRDNELLQGYLVGTDLWTLAGYRSAEALLRRAGRRGEAEEIRVSLREYERAVRTRVATLDQPDVPPAWSGGPARDWGNLSAVYPCGVLEPLDPRAERLAKRIWGLRGKAGLAVSGSADSLHSYSGADLATWALLADQPASWDSVLSEMMVWRTGTGGAPEIFSRSSRDFGANLPPHATAAAALLTTLRNGFVFDDPGDSLRLTLGTRPAWWSRAGHLKRAPTRWGKIDLSFELAGREARWKWTPVPVWTILRVPPGMRVTSTSDPLRRRDDHTVLAPPGTPRAAVRCVYE
jgi:hypothetical protein